MLVRFFLSRIAMFNLSHLFLRIDHCNDIVIEQTSNIFQGKSLCLLEI